MKTTNRKPLAALIALGAAVAMPMAFAQSPTSTGAPTAQSPTEQVEDAARAAEQNQAPAAATEQRQVTWADLDADGDGNLSKTEAGSIPSLAQVFDQADTDGDGKLTPDEYKAYVAKASGAAEQGAGGDD